MKGIILADLHMDYSSGLNLTLSKEIALEDLASESIDFVVLCGDNAELNGQMKNHRMFFEFLKQTFSCQIAFIIGNHEIWAENSSYLLDVWFKEIAKEFGFTYLEAENMALQGISIAGTYGHYDSSLLLTQIPPLAIVLGEYSVEGKKAGYEDPEYMHFQGKSNNQVCQKLIEAFKNRIKKVSGRLITISHSVPNIDLIGRPQTPQQGFYNAFAGTKRLESVIREYQPLLHFCGHTHTPAEAMFGRTRVINIGTDYKTFRYAVADTDTATAEVKEIPLKIKR